MPSRVLLSWSLICISGCISRVSSLGLEGVFLDLIWVIINISDRANIHID